jgi:hypothetical protein
MCIFDQRRATFFLSKNTATLPALRRNHQQSHQHLLAQRQAKFKKKFNKGVRKESHSKRSFPSYGPMQET